MTDRSHNPHRPWLHYYCLLTVAVTFVLVIAGGTVTSKGVGLAVPDWPTTYGYNMFLFPPSMWVGGVFWEHTHRLLGSLVGMLTIGITLSLWFTQKHRPWLRMVGIAALLLVIVQGVMGGLRVTQLDIRLAIVHGVTAQLFLCLLVLITAATGRMWLSQRGKHKAHVHVTPQQRLIRNARRVAIVLLAVLLIQLTLGATMRHTTSGMAIPDFPTSYGNIIPPLTDEGVRSAIDEMPWDATTQYYSAGQVGVHFAHRAWALAVIAATIWLFVRITPLIKDNSMLIAPAATITALLIVQVALGALVIWTGHPPEPHPEVATAHQACGAAIFATAAWLAIRIHLVSPKGSPIAETVDERGHAPITLGGAHA